MVRKGSRVRVSFRALTKPPADGRFSVSGTGGGGSRLSRISRQRGTGLSFGLLSVSLLATLCLSVSGCAVQSGIASVASGCSLPVRGHAATVKPRNSRLTCAQIRQLLVGLPGPGGFLLGDLNRANVYWHCRVYARIEARSPILACTLGKRGFAIEADR